MNRSAEDLISDLESAAQEPAENAGHQCCHVPTLSSPQAAALVRAIRRAHGSRAHGSVDYGGVERFTVADVHDFARRLVEQGVTVREPGA